MLQTAETAFRRGARDAKVKAQVDAILKLCKREPRAKAAVLDPAPRDGSRRSPRAGRWQGSVSPGGEIPRCRFPLHRGARNGDEGAMVRTRTTTTRTTRRGGASSAANCSPESGRFPRIRRRDYEQRRRPQRIGRAPHRSALERRPVLRRRRHQTRPPGPPRPLRRWRRPRYANFDGVALRANRLTIQRQLI